MNQYFAPRNVELYIEKTSWIQYRPTNQWTESSVIDFNIDGSTSYLDISQTLLYVKLKVIKNDGTDIESGQKVGLTNAPLHSIFSQVEVKLNHQSVSEIGNNYAYKAYLDTLFGSQNDWGSQLFIKDHTFGMNDPDPASANGGLFMRANYTDGGKEVSLIGRLALDISQQNRPILDEVSLQLKLWQSSDAFRLMSPTEDFKVKITDIFLKVAMLTPYASLTKQLKSKPAYYPYMKSSVKAYSIPKGLFSFVSDDLFQNEVPQHLMVGLVSSNAYHGTYTENPFNFQHFNCTYAGFSVNGVPMPMDAFQPNYTSGDVTNVYYSLVRDLINPVTLEEFKAGYTLYRFDVYGDMKERNLQRGHTRLELKFATALPEPCTVIVYAKIPALMIMDHKRNVSVE